jgi:hypothetical protein
MRRIELGGGAVAFELEGQADRIESLDPVELSRRGWKPKVVENYLRYSKQSNALDLDVSQSPGQAAPAVSAFHGASADPATPAVGSAAPAGSVASAAKNNT